ncbi:MAG: PilZ domain-containing protein [Nitrospirota bacterium]
MAPCEALYALPDSPNPSLSGVSSSHYHCGDFEGHGIAWNISLTGWRFSGNLPLRVGEVCSLKVNLSIQETLFVAAEVVRWERGEEYGIETLVMDDESREDVERYICQRVEDKWSEIQAWRTAQPCKYEVDRDL